jgi:uncharacterized protein DUF1360
MARRSSQTGDLVVDALASYRVTRLLVSDRIVDRHRDALVDRLRRGGHRKLVELSECPWCIGFWVACGVVAARRAVPRAWSPVAEAFAFSAVSGLLASEVRTMDETHEITQHLEPDERVERVDLTSDDVHDEPPQLQPDDDRERPPDTARLFRRPSRRA